MKTITNRVRMRIQSIIVICFIITQSPIIHAQSITPKKSTIEHKGSLRPCIVIHLEPKTKKLKKAWVKFLKNEYNFKLKGAGFLTNKDLLYAEAVVVTRMSTKQMDFYTQVVEDEKFSKMTVFISFGYDIYVDEVGYPDEYAVMKEMLVSFLKSYLPDYYSGEMKTASKHVNALNKEINSLRKDIDDNNRDIAEYEENTTELKTQVDANKIKLRSAEIKLEQTEDRMKTIEEELKSL